MPMTARRFARSIISFNLVLIVFTVALGLLKTGNPSRYFGEHRYTTFVSAAQLLGIGYLSYRIFQERRRHTVSHPDPAASPRWRSPLVVWLLMASGFLFLAVDEIFELHERMDRMILKIFHLPRTPLTGRIDDAILGSYGLIGLGIMWLCRRELLPFRNVMFAPLMAGFCFLFLGVLCDTAAHDDQFFLSLTGDLPLAKKLNGWFSTLEGAFTLLPEAFFLAGFYAAWQQTRRSNGSLPGRSLTDLHPS